MRAYSRRAISTGILHFGIVFDAVRLLNDYPDHQCYVVEGALNSSSIDLGLMVATKSCPGYSITVIQLV